MSNTDNHKKAIAITASCRGNKGALTDIYYKILEMQPSAIVNAAAALREAVPGRKPVLLQDLRAGIRKPFSPWPATVKEYRCPECKKNVSCLGIGGACGICDPRGMDTSSLY